MNYDLTHLTQDDEQKVFGPIQDDEALLLFGIVRVMRIHTVLEIGSLAGYSAKNFLKAIIQGDVYSIDINPVEKLAENHHIITKNCADISIDDIDKKIDMIFFDAHVFKEQLQLYSKLLEYNLIDEFTLLAFHDTNLHPINSSNTPNVRLIESENGWCPIDVERNLVNFFKTIGYDAICFHTKMDENTIPFRHGITIMQKFKKLQT